MARKKPFQAVIPQPNPRQSLLVLSGCPSLGMLSDSLTVLEPSFCSASHPSAQKSEPIFLLLPQAWPTKSLQIFFCYSGRWGRPWRVRLLLSPRPSALKAPALTKKVGRRGRSESGAPGTNCCATDVCLVQQRDMPFDSCSILGNCIPEC